MMSNWVVLGLFLILTPPAEPSPFVESASKKKVLELQEPTLVTPMARDSLANAETAVRHLLAFALVSG
jgi:hypothetical protein